jgi:hypothetical protein
MISAMMAPKRRRVDVVQHFAPNMVGASAGLFRADGVVSDSVMALKMHMPQMQLFVVVLLAVVAWKYGVI